MAEDSREGWSDLVAKCTNALMTGMGIGVVYSKLRPEGSPIAGMGGKSTGPLALMKMVNECGRYIVQGGSRRSAIWAGLHWNHPDALRFCEARGHFRIDKTGRDGIDGYVQWADLARERSSEPHHCGLRGAIYRQAAVTGEADD